MDDNQKLIKSGSSVWRKVRKVVSWLFGLILIFIGSLLGLLFIYEDEVKAVIISELNKHLKAEVKIDPKNIDLTIIKTFPDCSIEFKNVLILEALPIKQRDTLIFAKQLNLHFNIKDLWQKKYSIKKIKLKNGILKPLILNNGKSNYVFWEEKNKTTNKSDLNFNLELLRLENCRVDYKNKRVNFQTRLFIKELDFSGDFRSSEFKLGSQGKVFVNDMVFEKNRVLENKDCRFLIELDVSRNKFKIKRAGIYLNALEFELSGGFNYQDSLRSVNLTYRASNMDIGSLLSLLPVSYKNKIQNYESTGNFYASGMINYTSQKDFETESDFGIKNGTITYKPESTTIKQVDLEGHLKFTNSISLLTIKNVYLKLNNDEIKGGGSIRDFADPYVRLSADAHLNLANLQAFWPIDTLQKLEGDLKISSDAEGFLRDLKEQTFSQKVKLKINASVSNLEAQFKNDEQVFSIESGSITAIDRELEVQGLKLKRGSSDLLLNAKLPGFLNYLSERNAPLVVNGNLYSNQIKLEDFMLKYNASGGESDPIPSNVNFKLNANIQKFTYAKFSANDILGEIDMKDQKVIVSDIVLKTMGGDAHIDAFAENSMHRLNVVLQSKLNNINITQLFSEFNNFGQSTLEDNNIKGSLSAEVELSACWNNKLDVDYNSINTACNLDIEKGELIDFKPLVSLSKFVDLEDLKHIRFSALHSDIKIANKIIAIPKTFLKNSALNITFSGTHTFDNIIDYHIQLVISELLAKKRKESDEFGMIEEDKEKRRSAFISMTGSLDNPVKKFDRKGQKEKIKEDIKEEKQSVKRILKEELGFFRKEELPLKDKKSEQKFELEKPNNDPAKKTLEVKKKSAEEDF